MQKLVKLCTVIIVSICMMWSGLSMPLVVHAEDGNSMESRMAYISLYSTELSITSTGVASISGIVRGKPDVTSTYVKCTLQMSVGGGWVDVKSWESSSTTFAATVAETYQLSSRGTYRVSMECRANTEEKSGTSAYRTY